MRCSAGGQPVRAGVKVAPKGAFSFLASPCYSPQAVATKWYLFDLADEKIADGPTEIVRLIRSTPDTPRKHDIPNQTLSEIRAKVEKYIKNSYLKQVQAPIGVKPRLKAWMELS